MNEFLLEQFEDRLRKIRARREFLKDQERVHSKAASEIRKDIIELDGAEKQIIEVRDSVRRMKETI